MEKDRTGEGVEGGLVCGLREAISRLIHKKPFSVFSSSLSWLALVISSFLLSFHRVFPVPHYVHPAPLSLSRSVSPSETFFTSFGKSPFPGELVVCFFGISQSSKANLEDATEAELVSIPDDLPRWRHLVVEFCWSSRSCSRRTSPAFSPSQCRPLLRRRVPV